MSQADLDRECEKWSAIMFTLAAAIIAWVLAQ